MLLHSKLVSQAPLSMQLFWWNKQVAPLQPAVVAGTLHAATPSKDVYKKKYLFVYRLMDGWHGWLNFCYCMQDKQQELCTQFVKQQ